MARNPEPVAPPTWVNPRRLTPEEEIAELRKRLAAMRAYYRVQEIARSALAGDPPRPGEPPSMDPQAAWNWLIESRQAIIEEYLTPQPPTTLDKLRQLAESEQSPIE